MKIVYLGSGNFAVEVLKKLLNASEIEISAVITQKDKLVGRKKISSPTLIGQFVINEASLVPLYKAENSMEILNILNVNDIMVDYIIVADYGVILSAELLDFPSKGSLNVHGSLLPMYRGASPVQAALLNNDEYTGVSIITMVPELDAGPVWARRKIEVESEDDYESLLHKLGGIGGDLLINVLASNIEPIEQVDNDATYCGKVKKEDGLVDILNCDYLEFKGKFRAYKKWPGIYFVFNDVRIQIISVDFIENLDLNDYSRLEIFEGNLVLNFDSSKIVISKIKPEGKNEMLVSDFLRGRIDFFKDKTD